MDRKTNWMTAPGEPGEENKTSYSALGYLLWTIPYGLVFGGVSTIILVHGLTHGDTLATSIGGFFDFLAVASTVSLLKDSRKSYLFNKRRSTPNT